MSFQPHACSISSLEGDALLSIIASHLSSRQPGGQQALQQAAGSGDSTAAAAQLGSSVQGWEVAWADIEVERLVGRGAFGMVYLGRWNELPVAVKVLVMKGECTWWHGERVATLAMRHALCEWPLGMPVQHRYALRNPVLAPWLPLLQKGWSGRAWSCQSASCAPCSRQVWCGVCSSPGASLVPLLCAVRGG